LNDALSVTGLRHQRGACALFVPELRVAAGEALALRGPSGVGKSTLLGLFAGELAADAGSLRVLGEELVGAPEARRRALRATRIGFVMQGHPLLSSLNALENVLLPLRLHPAHRLDRPAADRARALLDRLRVGALAERAVAGLSEGERQRVALARALITRPALVLADEPTSGLDPEGAASALALVREQVAASGAALILVSHDPAILSAFDRVEDVSAWRVAP
jgi:ABC-type lipoprotein export system ATPase subunit